MKTDPIFDIVSPISDETFNILLDQLGKFLELNVAFIIALKNVLFEVNHRKGYELLTFGSKQDIVWFMIDGIVKETNINSMSSIKKVVWFWFSKSFIYVIPGFFDREPAQSVISAGTDCRLIFISHEDWKKLRDTFEETDIVTEKIRGFYNILRREHAGNITQMSITDRYVAYKEKLNLLFPHFPIKEIAEYMGMSADRLTKLRKNPKL